MKSFLFVLLIISFSTSNAGVDSLKALLSNSIGKERVVLLIELIELLEREDPDAGLQYAAEALQILKGNPDKELEAQVYSRKGWVYIYLNQIDSAKYYAGLTGSISEKSGYADGLIMKYLLLARTARIEGNNDEAFAHLASAEKINENAKSKLYQIKILNEKGAVYRRIGKFEETLQAHTEALELFKDFENDEELRSTLTFMGIINDILGRYDEALKYHHQSLEVSKRRNDNRAIAGSFHNIGILYQKIERYDESLEYYNKALDYWKVLNNSDGLASTLNSIGAVHELLNDFNKALDYYTRAFKIWQESGTKFALSIGYHNIGTTHYNLGNYSEALKYLEQALEIRKSINDNNGTAGTLLILASVYDKLGKTDLAITTAREGAKISDEMGSWSTIRHAHHVLSEIYENNGYFKEALAEYKQYQAAHDSMFKSEREEIISEMQEKYKSDEQKQQIAILERDNEIQNLYRTILIAGLILLILFLILLYNRYRLKQRAHKALQQLHSSEVERANLRTEAAESKAEIMQVQYEIKTKELNDARELQLSMLPSVVPQTPTINIAAYMNTATEVGGDYYDFHKTENDILTIAIGDATGHGVKAGIMVTAVKSLFNLLAADKDIADILCRSTQAIRKMHFTNLFMAFGLIRIKDNLLEAAGAGMPPIYIYRAATREIETVPLKGLPLGIAMGYEYTKTCTPLKKGDAVVLMSDGFPELFNSKKENLGYEKIPTLLKESGELTPAEIINHFNDAASHWLDGSVQQDDITFVVLKVTG